MSTQSEIVLMDRNRIMRSLNRMGHEIAEQNVNNLPVSLFGINTRGYAVARALSDVLEPVTDKKVHCFQLPVEDKQEEDGLEGIGVDAINNCFSLVVDDVIFSGSTMFKALKLVTNNRAFSEIHTAVLIDRGHRKFPIKAEFCGMELPTKLNEHVSVVMNEQQLQKVILTKS